MNIDKRLVIVLVIICSLFSVAYGADDVSIVVTNSYDWREIYLGGMYAAHMGAEFFHFQNLADSQIKTKSMSKSEQMLVLESKRRPVVKNYQKFLSVNDFYQYEVYTYQDFIELQDYLYLDEGASRIMIFDERFGLEALAGSPHLINQKYSPLFLGENNKDQIQQAVQSADEVILAGYFPVRTIEGLDVGEEYVQLPAQNVADLTRLSVDSSIVDWGVLMKADTVDIQAMSDGRPLFLYMGETSDTAELIKDSGIIRFEVIGASLADTASAIESQTGNDLKFLLKYARTYTGVDGLRGEILDIDGVFFDFQNPNVDVVDAKWYSEKNILSVTYQNKGNVGTTVFANIEFAQNALQDDYSFVIPAGSTISIPYSVVDPGPDTSRVVVSGQYGIADQLTRTITGDTGVPFESLEAQEVSERDVLAPVIDAIALDPVGGVVRINVDNPNGAGIRGMVSLFVNTTEPYVMYSKPSLIAGGEQGVLNISVPYLANSELMGKEVLVQMYYGADDTILQEQKYLVVTEYRSSSLDLIIVAIGAGVIVIVVLIVLIVLLFIKKKPSSKKSTVKGKKRRRK